MLTFCFGRDFDALVSQAAYTDQLFELLQRAERSSNLLPLLRCLAEERPNNPELAYILAAVQSGYGDHEPASDPDWGIGGALSLAQIAQYEELYLEQLRNEYRYIRTEGIGEPDVALTDVYVMLQAIEHSPPNQRSVGSNGSDVAPAPHRYLEMGLPDVNSDSQQEERAEPSQSPAAPPPRVSLSQALREHTRIVLLGEPGSGKSTTLQFLALCFAT